MSKYDVWADFDQMIIERTGFSTIQARRHIAGECGYMVLGHNLNFNRRGNRILIHVDDVDEFVKRIQDWNRAKALLP